MTDWKDKIGDSFLGVILLTVGNDKRYNNTVFVEKWDEGKETVDFMLTEEEKKKIEEQEQYAAEVRRKLDGEDNLDVKKSGQEFADNIMSEKLSSDMITNVVVPRLKTILEVMNFLKENTAKLNLKLKELSKLKQQLRQPYSNKLLTGIIFIVIWYLMALQDGAIAGKMIAKSVAQGKSESLAGVLWNFIIPIIVTWIINMIVKSWFYNKCVLPKLQAKIRDLQEEIMELEKTVNDYYQTNQELIKFLPENYQNPQSISCILDLFATFRVDSMKEAFNKCEELIKYEHMVSVVQSMKSTLDNLEVLHKGKEVEVG